MSGGVLIILIATIIIIWISIEFKRFQHKIYAYLLIGIIVFLAVSFSAVASKYDIDYSSPSGILTAGKVYLSWTVSVFNNFKSITSYSTKLDWNVNESIDKVNLRNPIEKANN